MSDYLTLSGIGVPDYSARGLVQTLEPIRGSAQLHRTINGNAIDLSDPAFQKYFSSITCTDMDAPALDGVWPGQTVTVECVAELCYATGGSPTRTVVAGSSRVEGAFTFYRPSLAMRVVSFSYNQDEYGRVVGWTLDLEEV